MGNNTSGRWARVIERRFEEAMIHIEDTLNVSQDREFLRLINGTLSRLNKKGYDELVDILDWVADNERITDKVIEDITLSYCEAFTFWEYDSNGFAITDWEDSAADIESLINQVNKRSRRGGRDRDRDDDRDDRRPGRRATGRRDIRPSDQPARRSFRTAKDGYSDISDAPTRNWGNNNLIETDDMDKNEHLPPRTQNPKAYQFKPENAQRAERASARSAIPVVSDIPLVKILLDNKMNAQTPEYENYEVEQSALALMGMSSTTPILTQTSSVIYVPLNCNPDKAAEIALGFVELDVDAVLASIPSYGENNITSAVSGFITANAMKILEHRYGITGSNGFPWLTQRENCVNYLKGFSSDGDFIEIINRVLGELFSSAEVVKITDSAKPGKISSMLSFTQVKPTIVLPWVTAYLYVNKTISINGVNPIALNDCFDQAFKILGHEHYCIKVVDTALTEYMVYKEGNLMSPSNYTVQRLL